MGQHKSTVREHDDFEREALSGGQGLAREFCAYLMHTKKWWITPIVLMLLVLAGLIILGSTGAAPFIYTLF
jgi:uncharacterized protein DUF5989